MPIRLATLPDATAIADKAIAFRNHLQRTQPSDQQFQACVSQLLAGKDADFVIATDNSGQPQGDVLLRYRLSMWAAGLEATVEDLFVAPNQRGSGIGRQLAEFALAQAQIRGCTSACLDTNEHNASSTRTYTQLGFETLSKRWQGRQLFYRLDFKAGIAAAQTTTPATASIL